MSQDRQKQQKELLIAQLQKTPIIQIACEKLDIARATYYRWHQQDKAFAKAADSAITTGELLVNDLAESQLLAAIRDKNFSAIVFWLKHHHPRYATKVEVTGQLKHVSEELTPEQEAIVMKALQLAALAPLPTSINQDQKVLLINQEEEL